ncbi:MAG TPA: DUF5677 domain-containing protein [Candidatus Saccharimonadales bacterium]|nr:DUF5677 domain-containing protein [Candidatus Saccharimonadales bacterium]
MREKTKFTVGGVQVLLNQEDVEQRLLAVMPEEIRELYVEVNGTRYPVKQALAEATGLHRGTFTSHDAMRVFRKLSIPIGPDELTATERFYTVLKSLNAFDNQEVRGVIAGQLAKTDRENCYWGIYLRGKANVESLLSLKQVRDFQAIAMLTRSLFEFSVDMKLIDVITNAVEKINTFSQVEKLRAAKKTVDFKDANPNSRVDATIHRAFIANNKAKIDTEQATAWPGAKKVKHWSGLCLRDRVAQLGSPFLETYEVKYPQMSWYTHAAGVTGLDLKASSYELLTGTLFQLASECYMVLLAAVVKQFRLTKADEKIENKMKYAQMMPFTDTDEQLQALEKELLI